MNSKTRIIVLKQKSIICTAIIALAAIAVILFVFINSDDEKNDYNDSPVSGYRAGVYSSTVFLNGNPVEIKVTIDDNLIHHISPVNISSSVETVFPLFKDSLNDIASQVIENNSTMNITYPSDNRYTCMILIDAINAAIDKAVR